MYRMKVTFKSGNIVEKDVKDYHVSNIDHDFNLSLTMQKGEGIAIPDMIDIDCIEFTEIKNNLGNIKVNLDVDTSKIHERIDELKKAMDLRKYEEFGCR